MLNERRLRAAAIISGASLPHREKALKRHNAVSQAQMLQAIGHSASAAVCRVAEQEGVSTSAIWRWRARVHGEFDPVAQVRWLLDLAAIRNSEILSLEEVIDVAS